MFLNSVPDDDVFVMALTCKPFYDGLKLQDRCKEKNLRLILGYTKICHFRTPITGLFSSSKRFFYFCATLPQGERPCFGKRTADLAAQVGALDVLERLPNIESDECLTIAAESGHLPCLKYLYDKGFPWNKDVLRRTAFSGNTKCLSFAIENGAHETLLRDEPDRKAPEEDVFIWAAEGGHVACLQMLHENAFSWCEQVCSKAASVDNLGCLKWLHENGCPWDEATCTGAISEGGMTCLQYAVNNGCRLPSDACERAALRGDLVILKFVYNNGALMSKKVCENAAFRDSLECLMFAHEKGCDWDLETCAEAIKGKSIECFRYASSNGCLLPNNTCELAAMCDAPCILKYAHQTLGIPMSKQVCENAAGAGSLECLQYAHENGCILDEMTCMRAIENFSLECLKYLHCAGCPLDEDNINLAKYVINNFPGI